MSCLHLRNLSVRFATDGAPVTAVDDVSLDHLGGETLALMGETGCGKSVIAHAVMRLLPANASVGGSIEFEGLDLLSADERTLNGIRGRKLAIVFQNPSLALNPIRTVGAQIAEPLLLHGALEKKAALPLVQRLLSQLGFTKEERNLDAYPFQFSGGMNQRVLIAASMVLNPTLIIADEPTKGLDYELRGEVMRELSEIQHMHSTSLLIITHDFHLSKMMADRLAIMYAGEIVELAPRAEFFREALHPYSRALLGSLPENGFRPIPGRPIAMSDHPAGCKFHPRCRERLPRCAEVRPPRIELEDREVRCHLFA